MTDTDVARPWAHHRARVARAVQVGDEEKIELARRDLRAARLELAIQTAVDAAPPLTDAQRARLAGLLSPPATGGGHVAV